jgi:hypothetical protein
LVRRNECVPYTELSLLSIARSNIARSRLRPYVRTIRVRLQLLIGQKRPFEAEGCCRAGMGASAVMAVMVFSDEAAPVHPSAGLPSIGQAASSEKALIRRLRPFADCKGAA